MSGDASIERIYFSLIEELGTIDEIADTNAFFEKAKALYGLKNIAYLAVDLPQVSAKEPYIAVTYAEDWIKHYKSRDFVKIDPTLSEGFRSILPLDWRGFKRERDAVRRLSTKRKNLVSAETVSPFRYADGTARRPSSRSRAISAIRSGTRTVVTSSATSS